MLSRGFGDIVEFVIYILVSWFFFREEDTRREMSVLVDGDSSDSSGSLKNEGAMATMEAATVENRA